VKVHRKEKVVAKHPRLQRRRAGYFFRAKVPAQLVPFIGSKEIVRSLNTSDYSEAVSRCRMRDALTDNAFTLARLQLESSQGRALELTPEDAMRLALSWFQDQIERDAREDQFLLAGDKATRLSTLANVEEDLAAFSDLREGAPIYAAASNAATRLLQEKQLLPPTPETSAATSFMQRRGLAPKPAGEGYDLLCQYIARGTIEGAKRSRDRLEGDFSEKSYDILFEGIRHDPRSQRILLRELIDAYENAEERRSLTDKTHLATNAAFRIAREVLGEDTDIRALNRADFRRVQDLVKRLPSNAAKKFPNRTLAEIADLAAASGTPLMTAKTATAQLRHISTLFEFAVREFGLPHNHAKGLSISSEGRPASVKRKSFNVQQLNIMFSAPLYIGCKDDAMGYAQIGTARPRRGRFWVPLIALFTGMRLNEICQLTTSDIAAYGGVDCIFINDDPEGDDPEDRKRIKTEAGERYIPIHPELKRLGFLVYVEEMKRASGQRLFPTLTKGNDGYYSSKFSKWFARFLKSVGVKSRAHVFHSFRHSFRDGMREAELSRDVVIALGGWTAGGAEEIYGEGLKPETLAKHLAKVRYEGLDLSHLYPDNIEASLTSTACLPLS
jgi:integrase